MELSAEWAAILITITGLLLGGFATVFKTINNNIVMVEILKKDVAHINETMDTLDDSMDSIWRMIDTLDSRLDTVELAHAKNHDENLRGT